MWFATQVYDSLSTSSKKNKGIFFYQGGNARFFAFPFLTTDCGCPYPEAIVRQQIRSWGQKWLPWGMGWSSSTVVVFLKRGRGRKPCTGPRTTAVERDGLETARKGEKRKNHLPSSPVFPARPLSFPLLEKFYIPPSLVLLSAIGDWPVAPLPCPPSLYSSNL